MYYSVYISDYRKDGVYVSTPFLIYDTQSPADDIAMIDPVVDLEDSKAGTFSFTISSTHVAYDYLVKKRTMVTIKRDNYKIIFEGVITSANRDLYKSKTILCEGFPTFLNDSCQPRKEYFDITLEEYLTALIDVHNSKYTTPDRKFTLIWDPDNAPSFPEDEIYPGTETTPYECTQYDSTMACLQDIQSRCKGHFIFSINEIQTTAKYSIAYVKELPIASQEIWFGHNLLDYTDNYDSTNLCTSVLPVANVGSYGESEIGDTVAYMPDGGFTFGDDSKDIYGKPLVFNRFYQEGATPAQGQDIEIKNGEVVFIFNKDTKELYQAIYNEDNIDAVLVTDKMDVYWGTMLKEDGPIYLTLDDTRVVVYRTRADFPPTNKAFPSGFYYMSQTETTIVDAETIHYTMYFDGSQYQYTGYYFNIHDAEHNIARHVSNIYSYYALGYSIQSDDEKLFLTTRSVAQQLKDNYDTEYLWVVVLEGSFVLENEHMKEQNGNAGIWNTVFDKEINLTKTAEGQECYGANKVYLGGWGGSVPTKICKNSYSYKVPDYTIGDVITATSAYSETMIDGEDGEFSLVPGGPGYFVYEYLVKNFNTKKVLVSSRMHKVLGGCFWYVTDDSNETLYYDNVADEGMTSMINKLFDFETPELAGSAHLYIAGFGSTIPIEVREYIEQSGSMVDYMTVEGADDYYYSRYEHHIDEQLHVKGSPYVESQSLIDIYGRIERKLEFKNVGSPNTLVERAADWLINAQYDDIEINLTGVDMHNLHLDITAFDISTNVRIVSDFHDIDRYMPLTTLRINLNNPSDNDITLNKSTTLDDRLKEVQTT